MDSLVKRLPPLNCLSFNRMWDTFTSERISFDPIIDVSKRSVSVVEFRNKLDSFRNGALDPSLHANNVQYVMDQCALCDKNNVFEVLSGTFQSRKPDCASIHTHVPLSLHRLSIM
jgi:hypothetical protein